MERITSTMVNLAIADFTAALDIMGKTDTLWHGAKHITESGKGKIVSASRSHIVYVGTARECYAFVCAATYGAILMRS